MKTLLPLIFLASCTTAGGVRQTGSSLTALAPTTLLGQQGFAKYKRTIATANSTITEEIENYNTRNPDPAFTEAAKTTVITAGIVNAATDLAQPIANGTGKVIGKINP